MAPNTLPPSPQMNYQNKDHLVGALIIAGFDDNKGGQVFGCPIGGTLSSEKWAIDGSGSTFIWAYCDSEYRCGQRANSMLRLVVQVEVVGRGAVRVRRTLTQGTGGTRGCGRAGAAAGHTPGPHNVISYADALCCTGMTLQERRRSALCKRPSL